MDTIIDQLSLNFTENFSVPTYVLNIVICAILLFFLKLVYVRYGSSISNRAQLSRVLILVGLTTFIIISIVKSSLALSLGLVGALSIVRFRTAIKEPEELGYFFMAISIGLGMGANQLLPTIIGFAILVIIVMILSKDKLKGSFSQNLLIHLRCANEDKSKFTEQISEIVSNNSNQVDLKRVKYSDDEIDFNFLVNVSSLNHIKIINDDLLKIDNGIQVTFLSNEI
ncbi:DUF4956 domain-containing protein [Flagellimonas flava]|uniref:DUF4956 domain-containing protein n=1 Tax=Flagellimonas flava TaxID=570519 RepID=A0A1M5L1F7_9FLAO|nr:DUF4956 domain-containing protein [Allomuricauda flava]SHG58952.1 protein of unknown function [Allomuricauda flava]